MDASNEHLAADEIALLLAPGGAARIPENRARHLDCCEQCRQALAFHRLEQSRLMELVKGGRMAPGLRCAPPGEWAQLVAGRTSLEQREELLQHVATCDACGATLRAIAEDFSEPFSESEKHEIE